MPCKIKREMRTEVTCEGKLLEQKSLRELSILRNTIYARYGWDRYPQAVAARLFPRAAVVQAQPEVLATSS